MAVGRLELKYGKWYLDIRTGKKINGKCERIRICTKTNNKNLARRILATEVDKYDKMYRRFNVMDNNCDIDFILQEYHKHLQIKITNNKTRNGYLIQINSIIAELKNNCVFNADDINQKILLSIAVKLQSSVSNNTINKRLARLQNMLNFAEQNSIIYKNPITKIVFLPKKAVKNRRALTNDEKTTLLKCAPSKYAIIWKTFLLCGLRAAELTNLPTKHVDIKNKTITIAPYKQFAPKSKAGHRTIPIHSSLNDEIKKLSQLKNEYLFTNAINEKYKENALAKKLRANLKRAKYQSAGITFGKVLKKADHKKYEQKMIDINNELTNIDVHCLRYTFCTNLISKGVDVKTVQTLMGHSSPLVTMQIYAQFNPQNAHSSIEKLRI